MADPRVPNASIDSGQLHKLNALDNTKSVATNLEPLESVQKQMKNPCLNNHMKIEKTNDGLSGKNSNECDDNDEFDTLDDAIHEKRNEGRQQTSIKKRKKDNRTNDKQIQRNTQSKTARKRTW